MSVKPDAPTPISGMRMLMEDRTTPAKPDLPDLPVGSPMNPFIGAISVLRRSGPEGFRKLRDILIDRYMELKNEFGAANVIKLALECDRHAIFATMAIGKQQTKVDETLWRNYQAYLRGEIDDYTQPDGQANGDQAEDQADSQADRGDDRLDMGGQMGALKELERALEGSDAVRQDDVEYMGKE